MHDSHTSMNTIRGLQTRAALTRNSDNSTATKPNADTNAEPVPSFMKAMIADFNSLDS